MANRPPTLATPPPAAAGGARADETLAHSHTLKALGWYPVVLSVPEVLRGCCVGT